MRAPKYRIWDKENKKWYEPIFDANNGNLFELLISPLSGSIITRNIDGVGCEKHDYILVQYTGLKDKFGKEIFEGNIIKIPGDIFICDYSDEDGSYLFESIYYCARSNWKYIYNKEPIIIGNIYENPELLIKEKN